MEPKIKIGKKGGAQRLAVKLKKIRQSHISPSVFQVVDDYAETERGKPHKKIAQGEN